MAKKTFTKDYLKNELELPWSANEDNVIDTSRWSVHHKIVFEDGGKYYQTYYSVGATECQDESPWEYEDNIECTEVEQKEVLVKQWVEVTI